MEAGRKDRWTGGDSYESYVGRWSRGVAVEFIDWLDAAPGGSWLDLGCGTGALTTAILERADPAAVVGIDPSASFIDHARAATPDRHAVFLTGDALALPLAAGSADVVVSGLVLNFIPDPAAALRECLRVARPGATIAAYVWDYAEKMEPIRAFWDAAIASIRPRATSTRHALPALRARRAARPLRRRGPRRGRQPHDRPDGPLRELRRLLDAVPERHRPGAGLLRGTPRGEARGAPRASRPSASRPHPTARSR